MESSTDTQYKTIPETHVFTASNYTDVWQVFFHWYSYSRIQKSLKFFRNVILWAEDQLDNIKDSVPTAKKTLHFTTKLSRATSCQFWTEVQSFGDHSLKLELEKVSGKLDFYTKLTRPVVRENFIEFSCSEPHLTITKINWLILFKEAIAVYFDKQAQP
jgi:hypothetical protein